MLKMKVRRAGNTAVAWYSTPRIDVHEDYSTLQFQRVHDTNIRLG